MDSRNALRQAIRGCAALLLRALRPALGATVGPVLSGARMMASGAWIWGLLALVGVALILLAEFTK